MDPLLNRNSHHLAQNHTYTHAYHTHTTHAHLYTVVYIYKCKSMNITLTVIVKQSSKSDRGGNDVSQDTDIWQTQTLSSLSTNVAL